MRKHPNQKIEWRTRDAREWETMDCAEEIWETLDRYPWMEITIRVPPKVWMKYSEEEK